MRDNVGQICALSVFCGLALSLTPEGGVKKATAFCCSLLLMLCVLTAVQSLDTASYSLELARYRELGKELAADAEARTERLNRLVIEQECETYILNRAASLGARELQASVTARWDSEGFWVPDSVRLTGRIGVKQRDELSELITAELGMDEEQQEWLTDEA